MIFEDVDAWVAYPHHRRWFNKLDLSLRLGYHCGPSGTSPERDGWYVVRPIYNLDGMGVGARKVFLAAGDARSVEPGHFWCEHFSGPQLSVTFRWSKGWQAISCWQGELADGSLSRFLRWRRVGWHGSLPAILDELADCSTINVELIDGRIIEVHLRASPDPDWGEEIVPVWADEEPPSEMTPAFDDAGGHLKVPRLGFVVR